MIMGETLLSIEQLPAMQNRVYASRQEAINCTKGSVSLVQDPITGIVRNRSFDPGLLVYDQGYQNEQSVSSAFREHIKDVTRVIKRHFDGKSLFEIGCGKGFFLNHLREQGLTVSGMDSAYQGSDVGIRREAYQASSRLSCDGIILRHVLEHVDQPIQFLKNILISNNSRGLILIEVPSFDWILRRRAWFDIYYEHVNYFRADDFRRIFGCVLEEGELFNGQYLYVVADLSSLRHPDVDEAEVVVIPDDMMSGISRIAETYMQKSCVIWGGASKGVLAALHLIREGAKVDFIVDINPAKQWRFAAETALEILPPQQAFPRIYADEDILIVNSNYMTEIEKMSGGRYNYIEVDKL